MATRILVLLLIILREADPTAACSSSCSSDCNCINRNLSSVPQDLPTTITWLVLDHNAITNLSQSDFARNDIHNIETGSFNDTTNLRILHLQYNNISTIAADTLGNVLQLEALGLSGQLLRDVNPEDLICEETTTVFSTTSTKHIVDSTASPFAFQSTMTKRNSGPADGTSSSHNQRTLHSAGTSAEINSQSGTSNPGTDNSQHIYNVPTDDDTESAVYYSIKSYRSESQHQHTGNSQSLGSYLDLPPSLPPKNQQSHKYVNNHVTAAAKNAAAGPRVIVYDNEEEVASAREDPQSHKYVNSHVTAAAKNAAAGPPVMVYENDDEIAYARKGPQSHKYVNSRVTAAAKDLTAVPQIIVYENDERVDNQSQTAAVPGVDSPNNYEPLRNPRSQQQHTYAPLLPHGLKQQ
ncbi:hypothetical protein Bbelb_271370 [Branchiostoma belcheri]|nr:hypothetical protein Bbelb_271370 [Branchiostoma belcheri]